MVSKINASQCLTEQSDLLDNVLHVQLPNNNIPRLFWNIAFFFVQLSSHTVTVSVGEDGLTDSRESPLL